VDEKQPDPRTVTAADVAEAAARAGLAQGQWSTLNVGKDGVTVSPLGTAPVRSEIERGGISWVDAYLDSDAAFATPVDPRMLRPAGPQPARNRAERRERANKIHPSLRGQRGKKAKRR
jgi:hypothetical protein